MNVVERIAQLRDERGWSNYKLAKTAGISQTTIGHMFTRNTLPNIITLESICNGFGITLSQFFSDDNDLVSLDSEQKELLIVWSTLTKEKKITLMELMKKM